MPTAASERRTALAIFAVLSVLWGYNWIVMKFGLDYAGPFAFAAIRGTLAVVFLFAILIATGRSLRPPPFWETLLLGMLQTAGFLGLGQVALVQGGVGNISVLTFTMPFWTVLLAWLLLGERMQPLQWLAVALAGAGLLLILQPWAMQGSDVSKLLAIGAGLSWAGSVIVAKRLRARHQVDLMALTTWQLALGMIPLILAAWLVPERPVDWSWGFLWTLLYAGIIGMAIGWMMWLYVLNRLPAGTASLNALAIPVIAVFASWLQFGERPEAIEGIGMVVIAIGLALMSAIALRQGERADPAMAQE